MEPGDLTGSVLSPIGRRAFMAMAAAGLLAAPLPAGAQPARVHRIGVLATGNPRSTPFYLPGV